MKPCSLLSLALVAALLCAAFQPVHVARAVSASTSRIIYVNAKATGANDGTSWQNAYLTLTDAITDAGLPTSEARVDIYVAAGVYYPTSGEDRTASFQLKAYLFIYGGFAGVEGETIETRNFTLNTTTLSGEIGDPNSTLDNSYNVVRCETPVTWGTGLLDGFTITRGIANGTTPETQVGGGIHLYKEASPSLKNLIITENYALESGGGLYTYAGMSQLQNISFISNATDGQGGGIYAEDIIRDIPMLFGFTCRECTFDSNGAFEGGGIYIQSMVNFDIVSSTFTNNSAANGGAILSNGPTNLGVLDNTFTENIADMSGGAIYNTGKLYLTSNHFNRNMAAQIGGAIANSGQASFFKSTFTGNMSISGGAVYNNTSELQVYTSTFRDNMAVGSEGEGVGGALANDQGSIILNNVLMYNNTSDAGGALFGVCGEVGLPGECNHSLSLINVTMSGNHSYIPDTGAMVALYDPPYIANSLLWGNDNQQLTLHSMNPAKTVNIHASFIQGWPNDPDKYVFGDSAYDPLFVDASGYDFHLQAGSPAFDVGDKSILDSMLNYDLDNNPRVVGQSVDLGVYEQVNHAPTLLKTQFQMSIIWSMMENRGIAVADLMKDAITDPDPYSLQGIAIIEATKNEAGYWQFSENGGEDWSQLISPTFFGVWVLASTPDTRIRFVPSAQFIGSVSITLRAWDQTDNVTPGTGAGKVSYLTPGGSSSYSAELATLTVQVGYPINQSISLAAMPDPVHPGESISLTMTAYHLETEASPQRTLYLNLPPLVTFDPDLSDARCALLPDSIGTLPSYTRVACLVDLPAKNEINLGMTTVKVVAKVSSLIQANASLIFSAALLPDPLDLYQQDNQATLTVLTQEARLFIFLPAIQK